MTSLMMTRLSGIMRQAAGFKTVAKRGERA
jgi:hypothetical protein